MTIDWAGLAAPFDDADLEWRIQRVGESQRGLYAAIVPYVTARAIFDRLDKVVGPGNWSAQLREVTIGGKSGLLGGIGIRTEAGWVYKWDVAQASDIEPMKGAASGAYKRAAVLWGMGRELYGIGDVYAVISDQGEHYWSGEYKKRDGSKERGKFRWSPPKVQRPVPSQAHTPAPAGEARPAAAASGAASPNGNAPTEKQVAFYRRLLESHVWTEKEKEAQLAHLARLTRATIKDRIDWLKVELEKRKAAEKEAAQ